MVSITEVIEYASAITVLGVTEFDDLSEFATLKRRATFDVCRHHAQFRRRSLVQHKDAARAP
jgi:hypothetical protein